MEHFQARTKVDSAHFIFDSKYTSAGTAKGRTDDRKVNLKELSFHSACTIEYAPRHGNIRASKSFEAGFNPTCDWKHLKLPAVKPVISSERLPRCAEDMLMAGTDTTNQEIMWSLCELMRHPHVLKKVQKELDDAVGRDRVVEESDLGQLNYLRAVIKESFRLHPVLPLMFPHLSNNATKVAGYDIPKNCSTFVNVYAIMRDPNLWKDPLTFNPDRFLNSTIEVKGQDFELLPFGSGRRMCPAVHYALRIVEHSLAKILHMCELSLPSGVEPLDIDVTESVGITCTPKKPLLALVNRRLSAHAYETMQGK